MFHLQYAAGEELAPCPEGTGCQRVFEPYLSPLLYKSITLSEEFVIEFLMQIKLN
jgi:hypothetical protein